MSGPIGKPDKDWVSNYQTYTLYWGLPVFAMVGAIFVPHPTKTLVWIAALSWMGVACLANAHRCNRTHCFYTGPFFLILAVPVFLHGFEIFSLGPKGWIWLGYTIGIGAAGIWYFSENLLGKYQR